MLLWLSFEVELKMLIAIFLLDFLKSVGLKYIHSIDKLWFRTGMWHSDNLNLTWAPVWKETIFAELYITMVKTSAAVAHVNIGLGLNTV